MRGEIAGLINYAVAIYADDGRCDVIQIRREVRISKTYLKTLPESTRWDPLVAGAMLRSKSVHT
jgi:hypothetical protein